MKIKAVCKQNGCSAFTWKILTLLIRAYTVLKYGRNYDYLQKFRKLVPLRIAMNAIGMWKWVYWLQQYKAHIIILRFFNLPMLIF